ncbi:MAG: hypothetical protein PUB20_06025 [Clostridia bacterium]|nr:hypothetical protein [Clostridia bacterium]
MKKLDSGKIITALALAIFALNLTEAYLNHKKEIADSISKLKTTLKKGEQIDGQ